MSKELKTKREQSECCQTNLVNRVKRNKSNPVATAAKANKTPKITDINDHCLIHIFPFLNTVWWLSELMPSTEKGQYVKDPYFHRLKGLKTAYKFVRCFGDSIVELALDFKNSSPEHCNKVLNCANKNCADYLAYFGVKYAQFKMSNFKKPYKKVERVTISNCSLGKKIKLNQWLPNMARIVLIQNQVINVECIENHFKNLVGLKFKRNDSSSFSKTISNHQTL